MTQYSIDPRTRKCENKKGYIFTFFYDLRDNIKKINGYRNRCCKNVFLQHSS